jgi:Ca2+/H+ antiporter
METSLLSSILPPTALLAGAAIGWAFGAVQDAAKRRYERLQTQGKFNSGWSATPGSFRRVAYLLVALALVQFLFPVFFTPGGLSQYCVSAGVVAGYGIALYRQMRRRLT